MLLSLNCGFKWLLKRATRALKAARWQASHAGEPALAASVSHSTAGGNFVFPALQHTSLMDVQFKVFLTVLKLVFVFGGMPCSGLTQKSHKAFWRARPCL